MSQSDYKVFGLDQYESAWNELERRYKSARRTLRALVGEFATEYDNYKNPDAFLEWRLQLSERAATICYPQIDLRARVKIDNNPVLDYERLEDPWPDTPWPEMVLHSDVVYTATVTSPRTFRKYMLSEFKRLHDEVKFYVKRTGKRSGGKNKKVDPPVVLVVGDSNVTIPITFAVDIHSDFPKQNLPQNALQELSTFFQFPNIERIESKVIDARLNVHEALSDADHFVPLSHEEEAGHYGPEIPPRRAWLPGEPPKQRRPLTFFDALRTDYSLARLKHYTGTEPEYFQDYVILTNYDMYVQAFVKQLGQYGRVISPGDGCQMPAHHFIPKKGKKSPYPGISVVDIGVGPSNAKNITDHLAVLRPKCWLMLGHCGGIRYRQHLGQFVLPTGYVREDLVLDEELPTTVPLPVIEEVQVALYNAAVMKVRQRHIDGKLRSDLSRLSRPKVEMIRSNIRTGTVFTTANRNWELLPHEEIFRKFDLCRAVAIDMESATIAANGYRHRIPYGSLLCVSDRPLHGELKMRNMAKSFYKDSVSMHLDIALLAINTLASRDPTLPILGGRSLGGLLDPLFR